MRYENLEMGSDMPFNDYPRVEKIRRKPRAPDFIKPNHGKHTIAPIVKEPFKRATVETPHLDRLMNHIPDQSVLISQFIRENGPRSVVQRLQQVFGHMPQWDEDQDMYTKIIQTSTGIVFERLGFLSLRDKVMEESHGQKNLSDPGSAHRAFHNLRFHDLDFTPDGIILSNLRNPDPVPTLYELYKYKISADKDFEALKSQIIKMQEFIKRFAGQTLALDSQLDNNIPKSNKELRISEEATITIVTTPYHALGTDQISKLGNVNFVLAPFPSRLIPQLAIASILDFGKIPPPRVNSQTA